MPSLEHETMQVERPVGFQWTAFRDPDQFGDGKQLQAESKPKLVQTGNSTRLQDFNSTGTTPQSGKTTGVTRTVLGASDGIIAAGNADRSLPPLPVIMRQAACSGPSRLAAQFPPQLTLRTVPARG